MKVLVTGGAGLIGSHLCDALVARGHSVVALDDLSVGSEDNVAHLRGNAGFEFVQGNACDEKQLEEAAHECDAIAHFAAHKIPKYGGAEKVIANNTLSTLACLELARKRDMRFGFASTSDVYGKNPELPFTEESDVVLGPSHVRRWAYSASKLVDEHLVLGYVDSYGLKASVLRIFNTYGPRCSLSWRSGPQAVFIKSIYEGKPVTVHGDGRQKRCWCYVTDTALGSALALESEKARGEIFNIGNAREEYSVLETAEKIGDLMHKKPKINLVPHEKEFGDFEEIQRRVPDVSKAKKLLGFEPKVKYREGLKKLIEWELKILGVENI